MSYNMDGYIQVVDRIKLFYAKFPNGSLYMEPPEFVDIGAQKWLTAHPTISDLVAGRRGR